MCSAAFHLLHNIRDASENTFSWMQLRLLSTLFLEAEWTTVIDYNKCNIDKLQRVQNASRQSCRYAGQILPYYPSALSAALASCLFSY